MKYNERYKGTRVLKYELENGKVDYIHPLKDDLTPKQIQREFDDMERLTGIKLNGWELLYYEDLFHCMYFSVSRYRKVPKENFSQFAMLLPSYRNFLQQLLCVARSSSTQLPPTPRFRTSQILFFMVVSFFIRNFFFIHGNSIP